MKHERPIDVIDEHLGKHRSAWLAAVMREDHDAAVREMDSLD